MATPAAAPTPAQTLHQASKSSHKRVFKSISRFLSGGGSATKQRPKLPHHGSNGSKDGAIPLTNTISARRSRSRSSSRSRRTSRDDDDDADEREVHRLASGVGGRSRGDSLSAISAISGADTEASMYAMSPSTRAPSSIVSARTVDSSSHASSLAPTHASTHKSYASTKPTTLLSVDLGGGGPAGANRIAVVPGTGGGAGAQSFSSALPSASSPSTASPVSLSAALPPAPFAAALHHPTHAHRASISSTSSSLSLPYPHPNAYGSDALDLPDSPTGVPSHTHAHPRNNPLPGLPPADNASMLTLASSSFAPSVAGAGAGAGPGTRGSWTSAAGGGLRAWSTRQARSLGGGGGGGGGGGSGAKSLLGAAQGAEADEDASVRALAGSRRASEESLGARSTWSAVVGARPPREGSVRSRAPLGEEGGEAREGEREGKERRGSMRTVETAPSIVLSDVDTGGVFVDAEDVHEPVLAGEDARTSGKGKAVDPDEHVGVAPSLAATAATSGLPPGGAALAPPVGQAPAPVGEGAAELSSTEASTPTGEKEEALGGVVSGEDVGATGEGK
ncbi:hypothetical protein JCM10449v2_004608 [Rhodotorula kratochvilovae]